MIVYEFNLGEGDLARFTVPVQRDPAAEPPAWARLEYHQCENCPLDPGTHPWCPPAVDAAAIAERFGDLLSYTQVVVRVKDGVREHQRVGDVQTALRSLLGVVMATSGCPILARLKGLARFHLPFATFEETLFRTVGYYLLQQYYVARRGGEPDFELTGLAELYGDLQTLNRGFKERLLAASRRDANANAIVQLFSLALLVSLSLESGLDELESFLSGGDAADASLSLSAASEEPA